MTLIRLCRPAMEQTEDALLDRIRMMEKQIEEMEEEVRSAPRRMQEYPDDPDGREWPSREEPRASKPQLPKALNEDVKAVAKDFRSILGDASPMLRTYLKKARLSAGEGNVLLIVAPDEISAGALGTEGAQRRDPQTDRRKDRQADRSRGPLTRTGAAALRTASWILRS